MKTSALLAVMLGFSAAAWAQIPNNGFENWTAGAPDSWGTSNAAPVYVNVTKSTTAHGGLASARGDVVSLGQANIQPVLQSGPSGVGFGVSVRHAAVTGWYQLTSVNNDMFACNFNLFKNRQPIATGATLLPAAATWTQFTVPFSYYGAGVPDTCILQMMIGRSGGGTVSVGSWFLVDDLAFSGVNDVPPEAAPRRLALEQNFPNPFNPSTNIGFRIAESGFVKLDVYNLLGQEIAVLVNEMKAPGNYEVQFAAGALPSGMYVYRLQAGNSVLTHTMMLLR